MGDGGRGGGVSRAKRHNESIAGPRQEPGVHTSPAPATNQNMIELNNSVSFFIFL